jgi:hypothetical protein
MKLIWMIIFKNRRTNLILFLFIVFACTACKSPNEVPINQLVHSDSVVFKFKSLIDNAVLYDFQFGVCSNKEELPLDYIFRKDSNKKVTQNSAVVYKRKMRNYKEDTDSLFGYFYKNGYFLKKFLIEKSKDNITEIIEPFPSHFTIKFIDSISYLHFDSLILILTIKKNYDYRNIHLNKNFPIVERFVFYRKDIGLKLELISHEIKPNEKIKIGVFIFRQNRKDCYSYYLKYQPWCNSIIQII